MTSSDNPDRFDRDEIGPPPADELDALLKAWHQTHAERAEALRGRLMQQIAAEESAETTEPQSAPRVQLSVADAEGTPAAAKAPSRRHLIRSLIMNRYSAIAASLILAAGLAPLFWPTTVRSTYAKDIIMAPDGGRLDALDSYGNVIGPCALKHTDVNAEISGLFTRVTVRQQYHNPYPDKIEALYTFPLSHRGAVDRMTMTVGDRVIVGEVHERSRARAMYEAAREQGYVASLLEQERPNIFTQSVANIEPNADVLIEISYVELLDPKDGLFAFEFPMVVGPRYIPGGSPSPSVISALPSELRRRTGIILLAPGELKPGDAGDITRHGQLDSQRLTALMREATPILQPEADWWKKNATAGTPDGPALWYRFEARYPDGSKEFGTLHTDGTGQINGRWFYANPSFRAASASEQGSPGTAGLSKSYSFGDVRANEQGSVGSASPGESASFRTASASESASGGKPAGQGFSPNTDQVPDASRITPMPVRPGRRAGHDISLRVTIDTGGPGIRDLKSQLHETVQTSPAGLAGDGKLRKVSLELMKADEIPNRDFVLNWRQTEDTIQEATFTHTGRNGNFVTLIVQPPARVTEAQAIPRELIFVLDTSGSMSGFPVEKAKEVMRKSIDSLRPQDTFNLITFSGDTRILWSKPRPFTPANRDEAQAFLASQRGSGGTEMMKAINAALVQAPVERTEQRWLTPDDLANLPADGRSVIVRTRECDLLTVPRDHSFQQNGIPRFFELRLAGDLTIRASIPALKYQTSPYYFDQSGTRTVELRGVWRTQDRERLLQIETADIGTPTSESLNPMRIVCFMTDGFVGNDMAIIDAVKKNARTTRVFSFGIGNSVNRYLLESMAKAGRGEVEYVLLSEGADEKVARFIKRVQTPVLTDIQVSFGGLEISDMIPVVIPDLFDCKPLIIHGRYTRPGTGAVTIRGRTASGPYERKIDLNLPASEPAHDTIATLWARAQVEELMNQDLTALQENRFPDSLRQQIIALGEQFRIMTQFTSFVAIEKARVTIGGRPRLVTVPIEMAHGVSFEGVFGSCYRPVRFDDLKTEDIRRDCLGSLENLLRRDTAARGSTHFGDMVVTSDFDMYCGGPVQMADADGDAVDKLVVSLGLDGRQAGLGRQRAYPDVNKRFAWGLPSDAPAERQLVPHSLNSRGAGGTYVTAGRMAAPVGGQMPGTSGGSGGGKYRRLHSGTEMGEPRAYAYYPSTPLPAPPAVMQPGSQGMMGGMGGGHSPASGAQQRVEQARRRLTDVQSRLVTLAGKGAGTVTIVKDQAGTHIVKPESQQSPTPAKEEMAKVFAEAQAASQELVAAERALQAEIASQQSTTTRPVTAQPAELSMADLLKQLSSDQGRKHAHQTLLPERIVLLIVALVRDGKIDEARELAGALVVFDPGFAAGIQIRDALADARLVGADRLRRIEELARPAQEAINKLIREVTLKQRLDPRLLRLAQAAATQPSGEQSTPTSSPLMVTVLTAESSTKQVDALKGAGLAVESVVPGMKLVVGKASPRQLTEIALMDGVRRVEPTESGNE